ncbi:MAG: hypothetical protein ACLR4A_14065 [Christensenellales bacterium]
MRTEVFILLQRNIKAKTGLEEAVVNQATVWPESGADRAAASRENPVLFPAPNQYNPNQIFQIGNGFGFFLIFLSQRYNPLDLASKVSMQGAEIPRNPCEIMIQQSSYGIFFIEEYGILCSINLANVCQGLFLEVAQKKGALNEPTRLRALKK